MSERASWDGLVTSPTSGERLLLLLGSDDQLLEREEEDLSWKQQHCSAEE